MAISKTLGGDRLGSGNRNKQKMRGFGRSNKNLSTTIGTTMAPGVLYPVYTNIALKGDTFDIDTNAFVRTIPTIGPVYGSFKLQVDFFQIPFRLYQAILHNNTTDIARKMNQVYLPKVQLSATINKDELNEENGFETQIHETALMRYLNQSGVGGATIDMFGNKNSIDIYRNILAIPMLSYYDIFKNYYSNKQEENAYVITTDNSTAIKLNTIGISDVLDESTTIPVINNSAKININNRVINKISFRGSNLKLKAIIISFFYQGKYYESNLQDISNIIKTHYDLVNPTEIVISFTNIPLDANNTIKIKAGALAQSEIHLEPFPLSNIDQMRKELLTSWNLGEEFIITEDEHNYLPYGTNTEFSTDGTPKIKTPLNGLVVKTYQSDMFNNWLDTEWVNEITETSAIDVSNGSFTLDMLNFKKKLYDHLNRLAISGGTYDDWQEATYGDRVWGKSEKPIYCGGLSSEVVFDEVISSAATDGDPLGTLAGRGTLKSRKGGKITIKVGEASVIMAIASLTPRLMYSQGNAWYNTELVTMDDLHKPIFDRIGFQDLIVEQMAWWDAKPHYDGQFDFNVYSRTSAGKQPAWLQYATDIDRVYGDFAKENGTNYMVLTRHYEQGLNGNVKDVTTYIDPSKYNYAFAYQNIDAQNFWTFIKMNIHARRKMSNTQIPNV